MVTRALWVVGRQLFNELFRFIGFFFIIARFYHTLQVWFLGNLISSLLNKLHTLSCRSYLLYVCVRERVCLYVVFLYSRPSWIWSMVRESYSLAQGQTYVRSLQTAWQHILTDQRSRETAFTLTRSWSKDLTCWQVQTNLQTVHGLQRPVCCCNWVTRGAFTLTLIKPLQVTELLRCWC